MSCTKHPQKTTKQNTQHLLETESKSTYTVGWGLLIKPRNRWKEELSSPMFSGFYPIFRRMAREDFIVLYKQESELITYIWMYSLFPVAQLKEKADQQIWCRLQPSKLDLNSHPTGNVCLCVCRHECYLTSLSLNFSNLSNGDNNTCNTCNLQSYREA